MLNEFLLVVPEILLAVIALSMQLAAVFYQSSRAKGIVVTTIAFSLVALVIFILYFFTASGVGFHQSFEVNQFTNFFKTAILVLTILCVIIYKEFTALAGNTIKVEFITLMLLSSLGLCISISSRNLLLLFCGLELQALSGYAMAAFYSSSIKSSEAGLKYYVLGALLSCLSLFGMSFIYGFSGSLEFTSISAALNGDFNIGVVVGVVLLLAGVLFKFSAAPMHMWTPDVYEGAPITAVTYFATVNKLGVLAILFNVIYLVVGSYLQISVTLIKIAAILSMLIGAFGAIRQHSLKRLMAYSTILNVGYVLTGLSLHSTEGNFAAVIYMLVYVVGVIGFFACLVGMLGRKSELATFDDIAGMASSRKALAAAIAIIMFSMIGLPPLAGFLGKYYVLYQAIKQEEFTLAFLGIFTSVIAAYYYLKVIKSMYFTQSVDQIERVESSQGLLFICSICVLFTLLFSLFSLTFFPIFYPLQ